MVFVPPSSIYGWVNGDSDEQLLKLQKKYKILKEGKLTYNYNWQRIKIQCRTHKNEFCSCFMNEAQVVFLFVFLLTYIVGSRSWFWEQCWWTWLWKSTDMNSVILMMLHTFLIWCSPWYEMMMNWFLRADESPGPSFINSAYAQMCA